MHLPAYDPPRDEFRVKPSSPAEETFRHGHWQPRRVKVFEALQRLRANANRLDRFAQCGSCCRVEVSPSTGAVRTTANYCHDRLCEPCGRARGNKLADALCRFLGQRHVRFATFTLKHNRLPLSEQITRAYTCFSTLKRRTWWRARVVGGCAFLEVKVGVDGLWHVHLHTLLEGQFLEQRQLSTEWYAVTGDSYIVDVRHVHHERNEVRYACKYVGKPLDASIAATPGRLDEFAAAVKGRRLCATFGTWRGCELDGADPTAPTDWTPVASLDQLWRAAAAHDPWAMSLLASLSRTPPAEADAAPRPPPPDTA